MNKKALSPIIATVLLISLVLVLAVIIFLWARSSIPEQLEKEGSTVEDKCKEVSFIAEYDPPTKVTILNQGNVPLYEVKIGVKKGSSLDYFEGPFIATPSIKGGETREFNIENAPGAGTKLLIVPVLLGKDTSGKTKTFVCDSDFGQILDVA